MKRSNTVFVAGVMTAITASISFAAAGPDDNVISQKKRRYAPEAITITAGESIKILNDDFFLHHAFIKSDKMNFDSGSMEEGDEIDILFKEKGAYDVLCAIHPKMKLVVTVE